MSVGVLLLFEQSPLPFCLRAFRLSVETSKRAVGCYHTVAWHVGCERIAAQGLTYCLRAAATYATSQFTVSDGTAAWHFQQFQIDLPLELGYACAMYDLVFDICHNYRQRYKLIDN